MPQDVEWYDETCSAAIKIRALCDITFLLSDISPLTVLHREYYEEDEVDEDDDKRGRTGSIHRQMKIDYLGNLIDNLSRFVSQFTNI